MTPIVAEPTNRHALAERFFVALPSMKKRFVAELSPEMRAEMSALTGHQLEAMCLLRGHHADGMTMNELAAGQDTALSSATALADRLVKQGLAERRPGIHDRRVVHVTLTPSGAENVQRYLDLRHQSALQIFDVLDDDEFELLVRLVEKVALPTAADAQGAKQSSRG